MDNLLPIDQIINLAKQRGVTFGFGKPKVHLAYLTKLHLLPQTTRRKIDGKIQGCYPDSVLATLSQIEQMKNDGLTYSQIRFQLKNPPSPQVDATPTITRLESVGRTLYPQNHPSSSLFLSSQSGLTFLIIGLFLGYLITVKNTLAQSPEMGSVLIRNQSVESSLSPSITSQNFNQLSTIRQTSVSSSEPIYLFAIPQQNLDKLGKVDINNLIKN